MKKVVFYINLRKIEEIVMNFKENWGKKRKALG